MGSEMCIRDRFQASATAWLRRAYSRLPHDTNTPSPARQPVIHVQIRPTRPLAFFEQGTVRLKSPLWKARIYYTTDGSDPDRSSTLYQDPFTMDGPVIIKARGHDGDIATPVRTAHFRELGPAFLYKDWYKPLNQN